MPRTDDGGWPLDCDPGPIYPDDRESETVRPYRKPRAVMAMLPRETIDEFAAIATLHAPAATTHDPREEQP